MNREEAGNSITACVFDLDIYLRLAFGCKIEWLSLIEIAKKAADIANSSDAIFSITVKIAHEQYGRVEQ